MKYKDIAKKLTAAGWEMIRNGVGSHQRWRNKKTGYCTTISASHGKFENYQVRNLEKQFGVRLLNW